MSNQNWCERLKALVAELCEDSVPITWRLEVFDHHSKALGYKTEMCVLTPYQNDEPYPVRSCIFSLHGSNRENTSVNHAERITPHIKQAVAEGIIEPIVVVFPSNGGARADQNWHRSPVVDMLEEEIFPEVPVGYRPTGVIHQGLHGHSLGGQAQYIFEHRPQVTSCTVTAGVSRPREALITGCRNLTRAYIGHHLFDPTNPITVPAFDDWMRNSCGRLEMSGTLLTEEAVCEENYHAEECLHRLLYKEIWKTHQNAIDDMEVKK